MAVLGIPPLTSTPERLPGRVAIVAGSGSDIGAGIARRLSREGVSIVLVDADPAAAHRTSTVIEEMGGKAYSAGAAPQDRDAADRISAAAISHFGRIDILIACADHHTAWGPLEEKSAASFSDAMRSFRETLLLMQAVFPGMRAGGGGSIIALGSTYGHFTQRYIADYIAAKEALKALVRSAAQEWGPFNIRVNLLEAAAETEEFRSFRARRGAEATEAKLALLPMPHRGDVERDIGGAALFLASDDSRYLTGEVIHADGGEHLATPVFEPDLALAEQV